MNVLSDILCGSSSLILSSSYNGPLSSHDSHLAKSNQKQSIMLPNEKDLSLLETLSSIPSLVPTPNTTDVENSFFDAPESIHASLNLVNSNYPMQPEPDATDFVSNDFQSSIPSWFSKDFMKEQMSANYCNKQRETPPLELIPDVRNENLTMLQLGFPQEIGSTNNTSNSGYMPNNQALLSGPQVYSSADSLLSTFTDMGSFPLPPVTKISRTCDKYSQNHVTTFPTSSTQNIMNSVLPLDNHLDIGAQNSMHLSLANSIVGTHRLTNIGNNPIVTNHNNGQTLEALGNKRSSTNSNLSLNQLDFLLDTHSPLNDMQITSNSFSVGPLATDKQQCSDFTSETVINNCSDNLSVMSCNNGSLSNLHIQPFNEPADLVDMNNLSQLTINSEVNNVIDAVDAAIEEIKCLKCKYCTFLSLNRDQVRNHIKEIHAKVLNPSHNVLYPDSILPVGNFPNSNLSTNVSSIEQGTMQNICNSVQKINCDQCVLTFDNIENLTTHSLTVHNKTPNMTVSNKSNNSNIQNGLQTLPINNLQSTSPRTNQFLNTCRTNVSSKTNESVNNKNNTQSETPVQLNNESIQKNKKCTLSEENTANNQKRLSAHKKAWQRKMKREQSSYICEFKGCNIRFHFLDNLEYHKKCHVAGTGKFACPECALLFDHWGSTAGHLWRNHSIDMELHACDVCSFRTYSLSRLKTRHKPIHQEKPSFECPICKKCFKTAPQLRGHKVIHNNPPNSTLPKKFACFICSRQFSTKKLLRTHLLVHNKQKSFVCNVCDYSASKRHTLKMHALQHIGEKPYKCKDCEFQTADHNTFRRHKMKHSGEKPYKCPYCPYACIQASTYKVHIKRQHPSQEHNVMFTCNVCSFRSVKQDNYIAHMADHEIEKVSRQDINSTRLASESVRQQDSEVLPLVEAMDISLFHGDQSMMMPSNKDNNFYLRRFDTVNIPHS